MNIQYIFTLEDGNVMNFDINLDRWSSETTQNSEEHPAWTLLSNHQCKNCPLDANRHKYCPIAVDMEDISERFKTILSYQQISVTVITPEREYLRKCDAQTGLNALLGLVMSTSACPIFSKLKPMAYNHLPFASLEETLFRTASTYLLGQYFEYKAGKMPDLDFKGLDELYKQLHAVNRSLKNRVSHASHSDSNVNAINSLFSISALVSMSIREQLEELRHFFPTIST